MALSSVVVSAGENQRLYDWDRRQWREIFTGTPPGCPFARVEAALPEASVATLRLRPLSGLHELRGSRRRNRLSEMVKLEFDELTREPSDLKSETLPVWRRVCLRRGFVSMTIASTTEELAESWENRRLSTSRNLASRSSSSPRGQSISSANFSTDGLRLRWAFWTLCRRLWDRSTGDPAPSPLSSDRGVVCSDIRGPVAIMLCCKELLPELSPATAASLFSSLFPAFCWRRRTDAESLFLSEFVGVDRDIGFSSSSDSNPNPSPILFGLASIEVLRHLSRAGRTDRKGTGISSPSDEAFSRAVLKESVRTEGSRSARGRPRVWAVLGGVVSGVGGLCWTRGVTTSWSELIWLATAT